jgi:hypothetical protein
MLVNDLAGGFIAQPRNVVLVGGTDTGKGPSYLAIARGYARSRRLPRLSNRM